MASSKWFPVHTGIAVGNSLDAVKNFSKCFGSVSAAYWLACQCVGWDLRRVGPIRWKGLVRTLLWWSAMTTSKNITHSTEKIEMRKIQVKTSKKQVNKGPKWLFKGFKGHSSKIQVLKVLKVTLLPLMMPISRLKAHTPWIQASLQYRPTRLHYCMQTAAIFMAWRGNVSIRLLLLLFISCLSGYRLFSLYQIF